MVLVFRLVVEVVMDLMEFTLAVLIVQGKPFGAWVLCFTFIISILFFFSLTVLKDDFISFEI